MVTFIYLCGCFLSLLGLIILWIGIYKSQYALSMCEQVGLLALTIGISVILFFNIVSGLLITLTT